MKATLHILSTIATRAGVCLLWLLPFSSIGQQTNNEIYYGGKGDGHAIACFSQKDKLENNNRVFSGGPHDGATVSCFAQAYQVENNNPIFDGGDHDGYHQSCYSQGYPEGLVNNRIFSGGSHDGSIVNCYEQLDNPENPLPIELLSFRGQCKGKKHVLKWRMASEDQLSFYEIERLHQEKTSYSIDTIGKSDGSFYRYEIDAAEYPSAKTYAYYRLYAVDLDGERDELGTIAVRNCSRSQGRINIYPVPSKGKVHIDYGGQKKLVKRVRLRNTYGASVERIKGNPERLDLEELPSGVYYLAFYKKEGAEHRKLIIE